MRGRLIRYGIGGLLAAGVIAGGASMAFASTIGPAESYDFALPGYGGVNCTQQIQTATTEAPYIYVALTNSSFNYANFTAATTGCSQLAGAQWATVYLGAAAETKIYGNTYQGESIKLMGGSGTLQAPQQVQGPWSQ